MINYRPDPSEGNWHISYLKAPTSSKNVFSTITPHTGASRVSKETNEHLSVLFCDCVCIVFLRRKPLLFSWGKRSWHLHAAFNIASAGRHYNGNCWRFTNWFQNKTWKSRVPIFYQRIQNAQFPLARIKT